MPHLACGRPGSNAGAHGYSSVEPRAQHSPRPASALEFVQVHALVLERAPKPFDEDVVHPASFAIHRDAHARVFERLCEVQAGKLAALVRIEYLRRPVMQQCLFQRIHAAGPVQRIRKPPTQHAPAVPVHHGDKIHEAAAHPDVCDVRAPDLIRPVDFQFSQEVRIYSVLQVRDRCSGFRIDCEQPHEPHQPPHALASHAVALATQMPRHQSRAVARSLEKLLVDQAHELLVEK